MAKKTISADKFQVSETNVRHGQPFGETEHDKALIYQVTWGKKVVQPFKVRPEGEMFGVYVGRRRFLSKLEAGYKEFVEGADFIVEDIDEEEARRQSLIENLDLLREGMDPMTRAHELAKLVDASTGGLRTVAGQLGIAPSTLSEWLKILELSPKLQEKISDGALDYTSGLKIVRMDLGEKTQETLADTLATSGKEGLEKELIRYADHQLKKGLPKGKYIIARIVFDKVYDVDMTLYKKLEELAEKQHVKVDDYCKAILKTHVEQLASLKAT